MVASRKHLAAVPSPTAYEPPTPPTGPQNAKYKHFARSYREYKHLGSRYDVKAMQVLVEFERTTVCWRTTPQRKFEDVIREERFCTVSRYRAFKRATETFRKEQVERLGVDAVCLLVRQPARYHERLVRAALKYRTKHDMEPTYQYLSRLINITVPRKKGKPTYAQLRRLCDTLKEQLREAGIRPRHMEV